MQPEQASHAAAPDPSPDHRVNTQGRHVAPEDSPDPPSDDWSPTRMASSWGALVTPDSISLVPVADTVEDSEDEDSEDEDGLQGDDATEAAYPGLDAEANLAAYPGIKAYLSADPGISAYPGVADGGVALTRQAVDGDLEAELELHLEFEPDEFEPEEFGPEAANAHAEEELAEMVAEYDLSDATEQGEAGPSVEEQAEVELEVDAVLHVDSVDSEEQSQTHVPSETLSDEQADAAIAAVAPANEADVDVAVETVPGMAQMKDALFAAQTKLASAEARLARSEEQAQAIINDALEQAALILERSQQHADDVISHARIDEERIIARGHEEASATRERALQVLRDTDSLAEQLRGDAEAEVLRYREEAMLAVSNERDDKAADAQRTIAEMHRQLEARRVEFDVDIKNLLSSAKQERANAVIDADMVKSRAHREAEQFLDVARMAAAKEMADASAQTEWAARTVAELMATADREAVAVKLRGHRLSLDAVAKVRSRLTELIATTQEAAQRREADALEKADIIVRQAELHAEERTRLAEEAFDRANAEAEKVTEEAHLAARKLLAEAQDTAMADREQADRRSAQAEEGARTVRQRVAEDLAKAQWELHEARQTAKAERDAIISQAAAEAEDIRSRARAAADSARAELDALTQRRNTIARELASLSGVIDALAVPEGVSVGHSATQQEITAQQ